MRYFIARWTRFILIIFWIFQVFLCSAIYYHKINSDTEQVKSKYTLPQSHSRHILAPWKLKWRKKLFFVGLFVPLLCFFMTHGSEKQCDLNPPWTITSILEIEPSLCLWARLNSLLYKIAAIGCPIKKCDGVRYLIWSHIHLY